MKARASNTKSRRAVLRAGLAGLGTGGALRAATGTGWSPKKQAAGLRPGQRAEGIISSCIRSGNLLFVSGIAGWYPQRRKEAGDASVQMRSALETMKEILDRAGSSMDNVLKVNVAIMDPEHNWDTMNGGYRGFFSNPAPARSVHGIASTRTKGNLLQVDCIAYVD